MDPILMITVSVMISVFICAVCFLRRGEKPEEEVASLHEENRKTRVALMLLADSLNRTIHWYMTLDPSVYTKDFTKEVAHLDPTDFALLLKHLNLIIRLETSERKIVSTKKK